MDWLTENKIPLGVWIKSFVEFLNDNAAWFFDFIADVLGFTINGMIDLLQWMPALLLVAIFTALAYGLHRSWRLALMVAGSLLLIVNLGYWE